MNGQDFIFALQRLGIDNLNKVTGQSFSWMFDYESLQPFLDWFCTELESSNVLELDELEQFQELQSTDNGCKILKDSHLEDALTTWSQFADESVSEEAVMQLQHELCRCKQRRDELKLNHDRLTVHHAALADQIARLSGIATGSKTELQCAADQLQVDNSTVNKSLELLVPTVHELLAEYQSLGYCIETAETGNISVFLSCLNLDQYHAAEEHFTQELVGFTKKRFFEGIAEIAGQSDAHDYEMIEITNPDLLLIKGAREDVVLEACKDLSYLHSLYPASEAKWINSLVEDESMAAACSFQEQMVTKLHSNPYSASMQNLSDKLKTAQASLAASERELAILTDTQIPTQVKDVASLQAVKVLRGDYDLKIARQDYFISNQAEVIKELTVQRARSELLTMALEVELRSHRHVQKLLTAVSLLLQQISTCHHDRMMLMSELEKNSCRVTRKTLDSRDTFMHSIHHVLGTDDATSENEAKSLFITFSAIDEKSSNLLHQLAALKANTCTCHQASGGATAAFEQKLSKCNSLLYGDSTVRGQPVLSPRPIVDAVLQLEELLNKLEQVVTNIIKDIDNKKLVLQKDRLLMTERQLFPYLFTAADRLRQTVSETESQLHATRLS